MNRLLIALVTAALLVTGTLTASADAVPPPYPTATFNVASTTAYQRGYAGAVDGSMAGTISVTVDTISPGAFVDAIDPGTRNEGHGTFRWQQREVYGQPSTTYDLSYDELSTFHPRVFVTDGANQTTIVDLPAVTILQDTTPPVTSITLPAADVRDRIASWRTLQGQAYDPQTGIWAVRPVVMQRRKGVWWVYSSANVRWRKGTRNEAQTLRKVVTSNYPAKISGTTWSQGPILGVTRGLLVVRVLVESGNATNVHLVARQYLDRL